MENPVPVGAELHKCLPPLEGTMVWPLNKNKTWKILWICLEVTPNYAWHALPFNTATCQLQLRQPDIIHTNALFTNWSVGYINSLYKLGFNWLLKSATAKIHTSYVWWRGLCKCLVPRMLKLLRGEMLTSHRHHTRTNHSFTADKPAIRPGRHFMFLALALLRPGTPVLKRNHATFLHMSPIQSPKNLSGPINACMAFDTGCTIWLHRLELGRRTALLGYNYTPFLSACGHAPKAPLLHWKSAPGHQRPCTPMITFPFGPLYANWKLETMAFLLTRVNFLATFLHQGIWWKPPNCHQKLLIRLSVVSFCTNLRHLI